MRFISNRRAIAAIVAASCMAVPASAFASADIGPLSAGGDQAQSAATTDRTDAAQSGAPVRSAAVAFPPAGFRGGDTQSDAPGVSGAPAAAPTTIEVVRPERTIVRDVDEALPLILSGAALLLVLAGLTFTLVYARTLQRSTGTH
jgi:hypothetical protein